MPDNTFIVMSYQNIVTCGIYSNDTHSIIYGCLKENTHFHTCMPFLMKAITLPLCPVRDEVHFNNLTWLDSFEPTLTDPMVRLLWCRENFHRMTQIQTYCKTKHDVLYTDNIWTTCLYQIDTVDFKQPTSTVHEMTMLTTGTTKGLLTMQTI